MLLVPPLRGSGIDWSVLPRTSVLGFTIPPLHYTDPAGLNSKSAAARAGDSGRGWPVHHLRCILP